MDERNINVKYRNIENLTNKLFQLCLEICVSLNEEIDFELHQLKQVLKSFQNRKSRDTCGFTSELFKMDDHSLLTSILIMINYIKEGKTFQRFGITLLYKQSIKTRDQKRS